MRTRTNVPPRLVAGVGVVLLLALVGCAPATTRPARGAQPGVEAPTPTPALPPTLTVADPRFRGLSTPAPGTTPGVRPSPSPGIAASPSPSPNALPPIVRSIAPAGGNTLPVGVPVRVQAVLVGRGADLSSVNLAVNGQELPADGDRTNPRQWTVGANASLDPGLHTARVIVLDSTGARGGFTWQFTVGETPPAEEAEAAPEPTPPPAPQPAAPKPQATAAAPAPKPEAPATRAAAPAPTETANAVAPQPPPVPKPAVPAAKPAQKPAGG